MNQVDAFVGRRIRQLRLARGLTQSELAGAIGVRFQQVQKYESGANRVSASRLWALAEALSAPISYFFEDAERAAARQREGATGVARDRRSAALARDFDTLPETGKQAVLEAVRALLDPSRGETDAEAPDRPDRPDSPDRRRTV